MKDYTKLRELAETFPMLKKRLEEAAHVTPLLQLLMETSATRQHGMGASYAADFVLSVWNHMHYDFNLGVAWTHWDKEHRKAWKEWAKNPYFM